VKLRLLSAIAGTCALLAGGGWYAWHAWAGQAAGGAGGAGVVTAVALRGDLEDTVTATGTLQPKDFVDVGTQVSGQLRRLLVEVGAVVKAGQLLAEIDPSVYQAKVDGDRAQLLNQRAQLADREAQLVLAELQFKRQQNLMREEATTADALQSAEAARQSAAAQVNSIKAQIQQTDSTLRGDEANLGYTRIYAPIAGTVVSLAAKQGQTLNANQQAPVVMRIANLSTMTVQAQVSEADVPKLRVGMDVYFTTLGGDSRRFHGKLRQIPPTPSVVNNVVLYDALFDVDNPKQALMTQMTAQVFFIVASVQDAVLVPRAALRRPGTVRVVDAAGNAADRKVQAGVMNRISVQILAGLEPGEKVVIGAAAPAGAAKARSASALVPNAARGSGRP
jgi:macrolide-specific efflux system membrane fusion protein